MISSDEISNWQTRFMIGTNLRAFFTPSTLKRTNFNGFRWDLSSRKNSVTFLASAANDNRNLFGAYWQSILGDVLKLGGTFVVQQRGTQKYSNKDIAKGLTGLSEIDFERYIYVIITDDSPESETSGAIVYEVKAIIDGKETPLPQRAYKIPDIMNIHKFSGDKWHDEFLFPRHGDSGLGYIPEIVENYDLSNGSWFINLLGDTALKQLFNKSSIGSSSLIGIWDNVRGQENTGVHYINDFPDGKPFDASGESGYRGYLEALGTDVIIYEFLIPSGVRELEFDVNVANDYCIDIVAALPTRQQSGMGGWDDQPGGEGWAGANWAPKYEKKHIKKAPGEVTDQSNSGWVKVEYNRLTGMSVYGLNMEFNWRDLFVRAEINEYNTLWSYPVNEFLFGEDHEIESTRAWFVNIEKDFGGWSIGGEFFDYPNEYMQYWPTIDDNDDNDWRRGSSQSRWENYAGANNEFPQGRPRTPNWEYPGLNVDWDRSTSGQFIDTRFTGEPYITYYFDRISFGDDFNHNGIIDERENDTSIDLPYERDSKGQHYFLKLKPRVATYVTLGRYDIDQELKDGRNLTNYIKAEHNQRINRFFQYGIFHRAERVKDDYRSDKYYYQYWGQSGPFNNLAYRNSWVNTFMMKTTLTLFNNLNVHNHFSYNSIYRVGDTTILGTAVERMITAPREIVSTTSIHKADYSFEVADFRLFPDIYWRGRRIIRERRIKELTIKPQFKFESNYFTRDLNMRSEPGRSYRYYPVLRVDYRVAPRTKLRLAMQGLPFLMEKNRNSTSVYNETDRRRMFLGFETLTLYQGFNLFVTSGMRRDKRIWIESFGRTETGYTEYFVELRVEASQ